MEEDKLLQASPNNAPHPIVAMITINPTASITTASLLTNAEPVMVSTQPQAIDAILKDKRATGQILGSFDWLPLPNFCTSWSDLGLVLKHDGEMESYLPLISTPCTALMS